MRRTTSFATTLLLIVTLVGAPVWAQNPHFSQLCATISGQTITAVFTVAGLGGDQVDITLFDDVTVQCSARGSGQQTSATTKVATTETFDVTAGRVKGSLSFTARCPGTQIEGATTFSNVSIRVTDPSTGQILVGPVPITNSGGSLLVPQCR